MKKLLMISFDAVGDLEFERLLQYPCFAAFARQAAVHRRAKTVFVSNTYPIHSSVVTGVVPGRHGLISNTQPFPRKAPLWVTEEADIHARTLWEAAAKKGLDTAAVLWPVTAKSRFIRYNIPEVMAQPGKSQVLTSLLAGNKRLQLKMFLRHRHLMQGIRQPALDAFSTACMVDILREKSPAFALMHLTAYDSLCHEYGKDYDRLAPAFASLNNSLSALLEAAGDDTDVIVFSDHSQINIHSELTPNDLLVEAGLLRWQEDAYVPGEEGCFIECCGGSAFFHSGTLAQEEVRQVRGIVENSEGFCRFLTEEEMSESGHIANSFGFCAKAGYCYSAYFTGEKGNHGYPLDYPGYEVFYMVRGDGFAPGSSVGGSLLDIAPLAAKILGLDWPDG